MPHRKHCRKEDYSLIRNQLSQDQIMAMFKFVCFMLLFSSLCLVFIIAHYLA